MSNFREIESKYNTQVISGDVITHITTIDTLESIKKTKVPGNDTPALLAIRQSRSKDGPLGVNVACNGGPFIYTFNHPADYFISSESGKLTVEGIQVKAENTPLAFLEIDSSNINHPPEEIPRFLPLQLQNARQILSLLSQSEMGSFLISTFLTTIQEMSPAEIEALRTKREMQRMFRSIATSTTYSIGNLTNFSLYGPRISNHLFLTKPNNFKRAGHGFITGKIPTAVLQDIDLATKYLQEVVALVSQDLNLGTIQEVSLPEVYTALAEFFDPEYYGLTHTSLEMFLDLDFKSFYWLINSMKEREQFTPLEIEQIQLYFHSLYHYLLLENVYTRHISNNQPETLSYRTYEPNGMTENFTILSPGNSTSLPGKVYTLEEKALNYKGSETFRLSHDYPLPITTATLPGLEQLELLTRMSDMQNELTSQGFLMPPRRI